VLGEKNIKSPSIKVENIWTRITSSSSKTTGPSPSCKSKYPSGEKHESQSIVQSVLLDLIHSLPSFAITTSTNLLEENGFAKDEPEYEEVCKTRAEPDNEIVSSEETSVNKNPCKRFLEFETSSESKKLKLDDEITESKTEEEHCLESLHEDQSDEETNDIIADDEVNEVNDSINEDDEGLDLNKISPVLEEDSKDSAIDEKNDTIDSIPYEKDAAVYDFSDEIHDDLNNDSGTAEASDSLGDELENNTDNEEENDPEDIWSSINEKFYDINEKFCDIKQISKDTKKTSVKEPKESKELVLEKQEPLIDSLNSSFEGWPPGMDVKDEFTDEDTDTWAFLDTDIKSISEKISDVKANQIRSDNQTNKERGREDSSGRKSRPVRKMSEETLGNPDSGKENADIDMDDINTKADKNHSPASKRRKISNRRYFNDEFEDSGNSYRGNNKRSSIDSVKSDSNSNSSRGRSISTSTDDGSECEIRKAEKFTKNPLYNNPNSKKIKIIDPSPVDPESIFEKCSKSNKAKKDASKRESYDSKISVKERKAEICENSVKSSNKPSKILIDIFDKKYEKARKPSSKKSKY